MNSNVQLRPATLDDVAMIVRAIEEIVSAQNETRFWTEAVRQEMEQRTRENVTAVHAPHRVLVAESNGRAVGFVSFVNSTKTPFIPHSTDWWHEHTWVSQVWVDKDCRGRGIAEALMRRADEHAIESGLGNLYDDIYECNARSQAFHEKCGFRHYAQVSVRENLDFDALRSSVASLRLALPSVELVRYDASVSSHRDAIHIGLIQLYGSEGEHGQPYGQDADAQRNEEAMFDAVFGPITTVARDGDAIVGWISCAKNNLVPFGVHYGEWWEPFTFVSYIWVAKEHRRRKVAQLLLENALIEVGEPTAFSSFVMDNAPSRNWHAKHQFIPLVRIYHKRL